MARRFFDASACGGHGWQEVRERGGWEGRSEAVPPQQHFGWGIRRKEMHISTRTYLAGGRGGLDAIRVIVGLDSRDDGRHGGV
jgi:hypothetical protein